ncbi:hypothetical protein Tco_0777197, partial [Tanacetum coccineum]
YVQGLRRIWKSMVIVEKKGFTMKMQFGKIKVIKGLLVVPSGTKRANCVYTLDGYEVTGKTLKNMKLVRRLIEETNVTLLAKNMDFNKSDGYKETCTGSSVVAKVEKIHEHESLTFNDTIAYEVIPSGRLD